MGLVCKKMAERVVLAQEDRRSRQEVSIITQDDTADEEDLKRMRVFKTREKSGRLHT